VITNAATMSPGPDRSLRLQCACTLLVAAGAAYVSYRHGREFALRFGADETTATLWPLIVDGLLTMATIELWKTGHRQHRATVQWKAWLSFILGIGLSLCANIASALELNVFGIAVAGCSPLALLLSVELLNQALKRRRGETENDTEHGIGENEPEVPTSAERDLTSTSPQASGASVDVPALPMVANKVPDHTSDSANAPPKASHSENDDPLCERAYQLDAEHWDLYQRPISAETLRRKLGVGSRRARALTRHIRQHHRPGLLTAVE
jgi:hypothetical protein